MPLSEYYFYLALHNVPTDATEEEIREPFDDIKILKLYYPQREPNVVDLEFDSKEEFTKAASLQEGFKIKGVEFYVRFSRLMRSTQQKVRKYFKGWKRQKRWTRQ
jgi:hypothetical protein